MHRGAAHGYILTLPFNYSTIQQGIGRLARIGQRRPVKWTILVVRNRYSMYRESAMTHKLVSEYDTRINLGRICNFVKGESRQLLIYEAVRVAFGQTTNKYLWGILEPREIGSFSCSSMVWLAQVYSRVAHLLLHRCGHWTPSEREGVEWMIPRVPYYIMPELYPEAPGSDLDRLERFIMNEWGKERTRRQAEEMEREEWRKEPVGATETYYSEGSEASDWEEWEESEDEYGDDGEDGVGVADDVDDIAI